jgi:small subunit ribosomal protein S20
LANTAQARKRARQAAVRRLHNRARRTDLRTRVKKVYTAAASGDATATQDALREAEPVLDRMAARGLIHRNKAARHKSRLAKRLRAVAQA